MTTIRATEPVRRNAALRQKPVHAGQPWLNSIARHQPELSHRATAAGICDEASYQALEHQLPVDLREALGAARFAFLTGEPADADTILDRLHFAPPWLLALPLQALALSARPAKVLAERGLRYVDDLAAFGEAALRNFDRLGRGSVDEIASKLALLLDLGPAHPECARYLRPADDAWLLALAASAPELAAQAVLAGITSDAEYLQAERDLDTALQEQLGWFRFCHRCGGAPTRRTVLETIHHAPPWLLRLPISQLGLSRTQIETFVRLGIGTVGDLAQASDGQVEQLRNAAKTLQRLADQVLALLGTGPRGLAGRAREAPPEHASLSSHFRRAIRLFDSDTASVLRLRSGIDGAPRTTAECARQLGLSADTILRLESRALQTLREAGTDWLGDIEARLRAQIAAQAAPLLLQQACDAEPLLAGDGAAPVLDYVLGKLGSGAVQVVRVNGQAYLARVAQAQFDDAVKVAVDLLEDAAGVRTSEKNARLLVAGSLGTDAAEIGALVWQQAARWACFALPHQDSIMPVLWSFGDTLKTRIALLLARADQPMYCNDIAQKLATVFDTKCSVKRVHRVAADIGLYFGHARYGLPQHLRFTRAQCQQISDAVAILLSDNRAWHAGELARALCGQDMPFASHMTAADLHAVLQHTGKHVALPRMMWMAQGADLARPEDPHQAVVALLRANGDPMHVKDLRAQLRRRCRVHANFQIAAYGPLVRLGRNVWGLADRDLPFDGARATALVAHLATLLEQQGRGLHLSELGQACGEQQENPFVLAGIALKDDRFALDHAGYLHLKHWGHARRPSVRMAIEQALDEAGECGLTTAQCRERAEALLTRPIGEKTLLALLHRLGWKNAALDGRWLPAATRGA